jgi:hypothetical protein
MSEEKRENPDILETEFDREFERLRLTDPDKAYEMLFAWLEQKGFIVAIMDLNSEHPS